MGSEYIRLLGTEEVAQAARNMCAAADQMSRAASSIDSTADRLVRILEEHARCIESAMAPVTLRRVIVSERLWVNGKWTPTREKGFALFHQWGTQYEEFENGPGNETVAIVEYPDGKIDSVRVEMIRFEVPS